MEVMSNKKVKALKKALRQKNAMQKIAKAMVMPLRHTLDYQAIGRMPTSQELRAELDALNKKKRLTKKERARKTELIKAILTYETPKPTMPSMPISSNPVVKWNTAKFRRFNVINRAASKAQQNIP